MFLSKDKLESHINLNHINDQVKQGGSQSNDNNSIADIKDCSLCEDNFLTKKEFKIQVANHLAEIQDIDVN